MTPTEYEDSGRRARIESAVDRLCKLRAFETFRKALQSVVPG